MMGSQQRLREALVVPEHAHLYQNNVWFRQSIDTLAQFLPFIVAGLVEASAKEGHKMEQALAASMESAGNLETPWPTHLGSPPQRSK